MSRIDLPAEMGSVTEVARRVVALVEEQGLGAERAYGLRLAAEEIATNIIVHGYGGRAEPAPDPGLSLEWGCDEARVWVRLEDDGPPFDPTSVPSPSDLGAPLSERQEGGLGIHLVRVSTDEFSYRRAAGRNSVTLAVDRAC